MKVIRILFIAIIFAALILPGIVMLTQTSAPESFSVSAVEDWIDEEIGWYSDPNETVPLYREYNPNMFSCNHNYTKDKEEHDGLVSIGWRDEGIGWYGV